MQHLKVGNVFLLCKLGQGLFIFRFSWLFLTTAIWIIVEQLIQFHKQFAHIRYVCPAYCFGNPRTQSGYYTCSSQCAPFDSSNPTPGACLCFIAFQFWFADIWHCCITRSEQLWHNEVAASSQGCQDWQRELTCQLVIKIGIQAGSQSRSQSHRC